MPHFSARTSPLPPSAVFLPRTLPALISRWMRALVAAVAIGAAGGAIAQGAEPSAPPLKDLWPSKEAWDAPEPWRTDRWYVDFAYYTWHFDPDPAHTQSYALNVQYRLNERWLEGQWFVGLGLFQNSFGQFSQYLYGGLQWRPIKEHQPFYVKLSAGLLHGYEGEYKDKIPFNNYGTAPAIVPSVGYCWNRYCGEFVLLGFSAALFTVGVTIP